MGDQRRRHRADEITSRWLLQSCPRRPGKGDNKDRLTFKYPHKPDAPK
jgi:hypothetical protein